MQLLGRAFAAAAGLLMLLAPSAAFGSWWDGGYRDGGYQDGGYSDRGYHGYDDGGWHEPAPSGPAGPLYGCENSTLPGTGTGLHKTTTPPPGTPVRPGDEIIVEITWRVWDWAGPDLHKAIDCVYINDVFAPELSGGERPTPNDGHFAYRYFVPSVPPGSTICDQGFVSGPNGHEDYAREVSNIVCFPVGTPPPPPPPPCCVPETPPCCVPETPPCCVPETPATTTTTSPPPPPPTTTTTSPPPPTTTTTLPEEEAEPYTEAGDRFDQATPRNAAAPPAPVVRERDLVLPRTGADGGAATRLAAGALGLAIVSGRLRRRTRP